MATRKNINTYISGKGFPSFAADFGWTYEDTNTGKRYEQQTRPRGRGWRLVKLSPQVQTAIDDHTIDTSSFLTSVAVDGITITGTGVSGDPLAAVGGAEATTVSDTATINLTLTGFDITADFVSLNISQFTNDSGYIIGADVPANEIDPVFTAWLSGPPNVSEFTNDVPYLVAADLSGYVPYTGATTSVTLGLNSLTADTLLINDSADNNTLRFLSGENLSADRRLTLVLNDADRSLTIAGSATISNTNTGDQTFTASGDATAPGSTSNLALTLATVNVNVGTFGSATQVGVFTVNGKGLITAASNTTVTPAVGSITGLGTGVATALAINVGSAGAFVTFNGALGTPSSGTLTNATGLPVSTGISGLGTGVATALAINVGSAGAFITFNGNAGTPSAIVLTNATGTAASLTAGTATAANTVASANEAADTTCFPLFITASGTQTLATKNNTALTFNSSTGNLGATLFNGLTLTDPAAGNFQISASTLGTAMTYLEETTGWSITGNTGAVKAKFLKGINFNSASVASGKVLSGDGTNYVDSTPTFPTTASATSRKIIVSNGTNWIASTELWPVPGTAGNRLISDGTDWTSGTPATTGLATSPTATQTDSITHSLGRVPKIIRLYGIGTFTSNAAATPTTFCIGNYTAASGNRCVFQAYNTAAITTTQASGTSSTFSIRLDTGANNFITGVVQNVGATTFDIAWTETGTATAQNYMWVAE